MSFAATHAAKTYAKVGLETSVATASPHQLILMLFDGALLAMAKAGNAMQKKQITEKGQAISQAIDIISNGLGASLNFSADDELANRLAALYDYMVRRLLHANLHNDQAALNEVSYLLGEIKSAWEEIADDPTVLAHQKEQNGGMTLAMLSVSDQLGIYEEIQAISGEMVAAAQANDWDNLVALESHVATLRDRLMNGEGADPLVLSVTERAQKMAMIQKILDNDVEIRRYVEPWMDNVRQFLGSQSQRRKMQHAYAAIDSPSESGTAAGASFG